MMLNDIFNLFYLCDYCGKLRWADSRQRTIYEYHRVEINMSQVASNSAVVITPLPSQ